MKSMLSFLKDENGQGLVEYALIIGAIAVAGVVVLLAIAPKLTEKMNTVNNNL